MAELKAWAGRFAQQHIYAGDFNAWPGAAEITNMTAFARDAWAVAKAAGTATAYAGNEAGNTRNSRIDYIWYSKSASSLVLKGAQVLDTRDSSGAMPSDHRPVTATFQVGAGGGGTSTTTVAVIAPAKVTADFDGDHKADPTVYRPGTGEWFVAQSRGGVLQGQWGVPSFGDVPVSGDYDGDGRQDIAVYRAAGGTWHLRHSSTGAYQVLTWGATGDQPVPGDYDSDGRTDVAVFRPSTGGWYVGTRAPARWRSRCGVSPAMSRCWATTTATARSTSRCSGPPAPSGMSRYSKTGGHSDAAVGPAW